MSIEARKKVLAEIREARILLNRTWGLALPGSGEDPELELVVASMICTANVRLQSAVSALIRLAEDEEVDA
ncbi:hypothetical protein QU668_10545 [Schaalia sp. HMT-877]|nr:hypothetical protein HMPREF1550_01255 [Actinomyces sp. oral taxon 877 str. F0543]WLD79954.1 hypothetical protein QU668_10545 [Schaalia sp. HMT-877]